jgi:fatty acid synthase subunit alpha
MLTCLQELAHILLVELLAYQFASPVRWIETQDVIFDASMNMERLIEIGPSPTLAGMATRTLKTKYEGYDQALGMQRQVLAYAKEGKEIYYNVDPPEPAEEAAPAAAAAAAPAPAAAAAPAPVAAPAAAPAGPAAQIDDVPVKATEIVHTVVAQKLKKSVDDIPVQKAIKDLVGGKSTLQVPLSSISRSIINVSRTKFSETCKRNSDPCRWIPPKTSPSTNSAGQSNPLSRAVSASSVPA